MTPGSVTPTALLKQPSDISLQFTPSPVYPDLQLHSNDPGLFTQSDLDEQLLASGVLHSSTSLQFAPSPVYPDLHWHSNDPGLLTQFAFDEQLLEPGVLHSSTSLQSTPSPM